MMNRTLLFVAMVMAMALAKAQDKAVVIYKKNGCHLALKSTEIDSMVYTGTATLGTKLYWADSVFISKTDTVFQNIPVDQKKYAYKGTTTPRLATKSQEYSFVQTSNNALAGQSAAAYGDYLFIVKDKLAGIYMYNLRTKTRVASLTLTPHTETVSSSSTTVLYHCNQSTFGTIKYAESDPFPLLYISQRGPSSTGRAFVVVLRIIPTLNARGTEYNSFKVEQVQTIYLPKMTFLNSMGNANFTIDPQTGYFYTYSRNNTSYYSNYLKCKISKFKPFGIDNSEVYLNDADIVESYYIYNSDGTAVSAENMQGAFIWNHKMYIGRGYPSVNYIHLYIVDLQEKKLSNFIDLMGDGFAIEPEGVCMYDGHVILHCNGSPIYTLYFK